ncbi:MAG: CPBP family intramembrane metalloprotease [Planctomycetales bacterium]|nr:CPBP family intramembrane metalloprotease [Planctomycetales bacterium]
MAEGLLNIIGDADNQQEQVCDGTTNPVCYWTVSSRPLASLVFIAPMLIAYEVGILILGPDAMRNGVDVWLRMALDLIGFGQYFLLPSLTVTLLLAWHHVLREKWRMTPSIFSLMWMESTAFGIALIVIAQIVAAVLADIGAPACDTTVATSRSGASAAHLLGFLGAGIYEELLFRLLLIPAIGNVLFHWGESPRVSLWAAIGVSSICFSAAHFQAFAGFGEAFAWYSFTFRFLAGIFFGVLFVRRGFGITVGAHALYDLLVGLFYSS